MEFRTESNTVLEHKSLKSLEVESLAFGFIDGKISGICASESDDTWTLNFKRGILSAFQNSFDGNYETTTETEVRKSK